MSLLTDDEIDTIWRTHLSRDSRAGAIEALVIRKLAGVIVEPVGVVRQLHIVEVRFDSNTSHGSDLPDGTKLHTATQLAAARVQALEEAAVICARNSQNTSGAEIRALIGK